MVISKEFIVDAKGGAPPFAPWLDTGVDLLAGKGLFIQAWGSVNLYSHDDSMLWTGPDGCLNNIGEPTDDPPGCNLVFEWALLIPNRPGAKLIGRIGDEGTPFEIGSMYLNPIEASGRLYLTINDYTGLDSHGNAIYYLDNRGEFETRILANFLLSDVNEPCAHVEPRCTSDIYGHKQKYSGKPVGLLDGDKTEEITDITLQSVADALTLTRQYRQSALKDEDFPRVMGLGWSHNHNLYLDTDHIADKLFVYGAGGGRIQFEENTSIRYVASAGGTSVIEIDIHSSLERYQWISSNETLVFDEEGRLRFRRWVHGEEWTYSYYDTPHVAEGCLKEVSDGYGRKLQFVYVDNVTSFDHLQLWRVGDHTTTDLDISPTGPYIEYGYSENKMEDPNDSEAVIDGGKPLLASVRDLSGHVWTYSYEQENLDTLNWLFRIESSLVDTDGDGVDDNTIILKNIAYSIDGGDVVEINQQLGGVGDVSNATYARQVDYIFRPDGAEITQEIVAGRITNHYFVNGVYWGEANALDQITQQAFDINYRPKAQEDAYNNRTNLAWSSDGKHLESVTDALSHETHFQYDTEDRLIRAIDAEGRITEYEYEDTNVPRQPTIVKVLASDETTVLRQDVFEYDNKGRTLKEMSLDPSDGVTVLRETVRTYHASGAGHGLLASITQVDLEDASNNQTTSYTYDSAGRIIKTQRSSTFGNCDIAFTVYDMAGNVVASICNYDPDTSPDPTTAEEAAALYDEAYPDKNQVTTHVYDAMGRRVRTTTRTGSAFAQTTLTLLDALDRPWRVINHYRNPLVSEDPDEYTYTAPGEWVWDAVEGRWQDGLGTPIAHGEDSNENLITDTAYNGRGNVRLRRDVLGSVTLYGYDDADRLVKTVQHASDPDYDNDYAEGDPDLSDYVAVSASDADIMSQQAYDANGNLIQAVNPIGITTLTAYDALNRAVEVVSSASDANYDMLLYRNFDEYTFSDAPDRDLRQQTVYDALGRVIETKQLIQQVGAVETWTTTRNVYDALGRVRLTIRHYVEQTNEFDEIEDPALWQWHEDNARWQLSDGTPIVHGEHHDQNIISEQVYDEAGRVLFTRDMVGTKTWLTYDGLGRQVKQIAGCTYDGSGTAPEDEAYIGQVGDPSADVISESYFDVDGRVVKMRRLLRYDSTEDALVWDWTLTGYDALGRQVRVIQHASDPTYDVTSDPDLSAYNLSGEADEDLLTQTYYDAQGRVYKTVDAMGRVTLHGFDTSGRQVRVIQNASDPDYDVTNDPSLSAYVVSSEMDEDLISETQYDLAGRVMRLKDVLGQVTFYGYDRAGRRVKTIQNASDPDYDVAGDPTLTAYVAGSNADEDRISATAYDKAGRMWRSVDAQGQMTLYGYDGAGRQVMVIRNASDAGYDATTDPDLSQYIPDSQAEIDQDRITITSYDKGGRVISHVDDAGMVTQHFYDALGRRIRSVMAYLPQGETSPADWVWSAKYHCWQDGAGNPIDHGEDFDRNLISDTVYDLAGRVSKTRDARGTVTHFSYDRLARRLTVTEAEGTDIATTSYTCYDKAGRVERIIQNWRNNGISPDAKHEGAWLFQPTKHGSRHDRNLISQFNYDLAGRRTSVTDPLGNVTMTMSYARDGQVMTETDAEGMVTFFGYDGLGRRVMVVQGYISNGEDPALWQWHEGNARWQESDGTPIAHGTHQDQNIIVQVTLDEGGRMVALRNPLGHLTQYEYDGLGRRTKLTNASDTEWLTAYEDLLTGGTRITMTYPGLSSGGDYLVQRDFDRLGRLVAIDYGDAATTPRVELAYDEAGNRAVMREYDESQLMRQTHYDYDMARRLVEVGLDDDGDDVIEQTVSYAYDVGGRRTRMTLPDNLDVTYRYDAKGQLIGLTDWAGQLTSFMYDDVGRQVLTQRANGLASDYRYNEAGHLMKIRHFVGVSNSLKAQFSYKLDKRGNRIRASEYMASPTSILVTYDKDAPEITYQSAWTDAGDFKHTERRSAKLFMTWTGDEGLLTVGTGPDHGIFDVYIGGSLWQSYNGYAPTEGERVIHLPLAGELEIRNTINKQRASTGHVLRFKRLEAVTVSYAERTIQYTYDALSRLIEADYGATQVTYGFDAAGNLVNNNGATRTYNAANQMTHDGTNTLTYDDNGNLTSDGVNSYVWNRANRLLEVNNGTPAELTQYAYDGLNNRISQAIGTSSSVVTQYLLDTQPSLVKVVAQTTSGNTDRFVHSPRGIHAMQNNIGDWSHMVQDGLGSVRQEVDTSLNILTAHNYTPYGTPNTFQSKGYFYEN